MRAVRSDPDADLVSALTAARMTVNDLMLFVGVDPDDARAATRPEVAEQPELEARALPTPVRPRFRRWLANLPRWTTRRRRS